jgi:hypothetical protein
MLITEELYLLLTKDSGTQEQPGTQRGYGLSAALITDLVVAGSVTLTEEKKPRVHVVNADPTAHPVLDQGLAFLAAKDGKRIDTLVTATKLNPEDAVVESLVRQGILSIGSRTMLGLGKPRTPEIDPAPERELRQRLEWVLAGGKQADLTEATLLSILQALDVAKKILAAESGGMRGKDLKARIKAVVHDSPTGDAVQRSVQAVNAALMSAAIIPAVVAGGASG